MTEQEGSPAEYWDIDALAMALASDPVPQLHKVHGQGHSFNLGDPYYPTAEVQVFPQTGLVRYQADGISIALTKAIPYYTQATGVMFNGSTPDEARTLFIGDQGEVTLYTTPRETTAISQSPDEKSKTLVGRLITDPIEGRTRHGAPMTRMAIKVDGNDASTDVFAFGWQAVESALYFHRGGDYQLKGEHKTYGQNGNEREVFVVSDMKIGRGGAST